MPRRRRRFFTRIRHLLYGAMITAATVIGPSKNANAVPSFGAATGQPCAACHVGAVGPQLTQYGRDFKQFGYVATDNLPHLPPISLATTGSFTHTNQPNPNPPAHFAANDDFAADSTSIFYAGRITPTLGAFIEGQYDGVGRDFFLGDVDIRRPFKTFELFGQDRDWGLTVNDVPTESDIWNSTPVWGFPFVSSRTAATPMASTLIDAAALAGRVLGAGLHGMWNDTLFLESDLYRDVNPWESSAIGTKESNPNTNTYAVVIPYWRAALQHEFDDGVHYAQIGTYGISADSYPGGITTAGSDHFTDYAFDANYQFWANPKEVTSTHITADATWIHERQHLVASSVVTGTNLHDSLTTFRANLAYSIDATWTPRVQYFVTTGSTDAANFTTPTGSPNSSGLISEIIYVPWGKPDSPVAWFNARVGLQYVAYAKLDGQASHASDHNTLFLSLKFALAPLAPFNK